MNPLNALKEECFKRCCKHDEDSTCCFCRHECYICAHDRISHLVLHHYTYNENSVIYNQFDNTNDGRLEYYVSLLKEIKKSRDNFIILCMKCHESLEDMLRNPKSEEFDRPMDERRERLKKIYNNTIHYRITKNHIGLDGFFLEKKDKDVMERFFWK